jgi:flavin-dependent dehydrogenase
MKQTEQTDLLIVGSGPTGSSVALHLVQRDPAWAGRMLVVDKATHPRDKLCGGGITHVGQNILADLGLKLPVPAFPVREVRLLYEEQAYSFRGDPVFRIVRRRDFDHWLVQEVRQRGVRVSEGEGVEDIAVQPTHVRVTTTQRVIEAQIVVAADGSRSFVRSRLKWEDDSRVARLLEVDTPEDAETQWEFRERVAIFDFSRLADGLQGYYWDFPSYVNGEPVMNRGVFDSRAVPNRPKPNLPDELRRMLAHRHRDLDDYTLKGHPIRWFDRRGKFAIPRVLLAGDAAGVDPLFGEGISFAVGYGPPVADTIQDAFLRHDFSLDSYRNRLLRDPLFRHLDLRVRLSRFAYLLKYPRLFRAGWWLARHIIRLTPWANPNFAPSRLELMDNG